MALRLDRGRLMDAVRAASAFRNLTRGLEVKTVRVARQLAGERTERRTGAYEEGFEARFKPLASKSVLGRLRLENDAPHAEFLESGTKEHSGNPRMFFFSVRHGHVIGPKKVKGIAAKHVIRDALLRVANGRTI